MNKIITKIRDLIRSNKKTFSFFAIITTITIATSAYFFIQNYLHPRPLTIGFITDIHAGNQVWRDDGADPKISPDNILVPRDFEKNLQSVFSNTRNTDFIMTLGDNLNGTSKKYAQKLLDATSGHKIYWTKGNHDKKALFQMFSEKNYYYFDKGNWRFIVLDNSESFKDENGSPIGHGYIDPTQIDWLKESLKTTRNVLVTMHVPLFRIDNLNSVRPEMQDLQNIFEQSGNVKYVLSGHFHVFDKTIELNGIKYVLVPSMSWMNHEGSYITLTLE